MYTHTYVYTYTYIYIYIHIYIRSLLFFPQQRLRLGFQSVPFGRLLNPRAASELVAGNGCRCHLLASVAGNAFWSSWFWCRCICRCRCRCRCTCSRIYIPIYTQIYIYTYLYTHTYTHICIYTCAKPYFLTDHPRRPAAKPYFYGSSRRTGRIRGEAPRQREPSLARGGRARRRIIIFSEFIDCMVVTIREFEVDKFGTKGCRVV